VIARPDGPGYEICEVILAEPVPLLCLSYRRGRAEQCGKGAGELVRRGPGPGQDRPDDYRIKSRLKVSRTSETGMLFFMLILLPSPGGE
jgi:hypothetical protein